MDDTAPTSSTVRNGGGGRGENAGWWVREAGCGRNHSAVTDELIPFKKSAKSSVKKARFMTSDIPDEFVHISSMLNAWLATQRITAKEELMNGINKPLDTVI